MRWLLPSVFTAALIFAVPSYAQKPKPKAGLLVRPDLPPEKQSRCHLRQYVATFKLTFNSLNIAHVAQTVADASCASFQFQEQQLRGAISTAGLELQLESAELKDLFLRSLTLLGYDTKVRGDLVTVTASKRENPPAVVRWEKTANGFDVVPGS